MNFESVISVIILGVTLLDKRIGGLGGDTTHIVSVSGYLMPNTRPKLDVVYKNCKIIEIERHDTYVDGEKKKQEVYNVKAYADKEALWKDALSMIKRFQLQSKPVLLFGFHEYT